MALQFKAFRMLEFTYRIPANRYIDLLQYVWLNQAGRWLKDNNVATQDAVEQMIRYIGQGGFNAFVPENGVDDPNAFAKLYKDTFQPPKDNRLSARIRRSGHFRRLS